MKSKGGTTLYWMTKGDTRALKRTTYLSSFLGFRLTCSSLWQEKRRNMYVSRLKKDIKVFYYSSRTSKAILTNKTLMLICQTSTTVWSTEMMKSD